MKKSIFLFSTVLFLATVGFSQAQLNKDAMAPELKAIKAMPQYRVKTIDINSDTITKKQDVRKLVEKVDSSTDVIRIQNNIIIDKQDSLVEQIAINESVINGIKKGTFTFISLINWLFIVVFIVITWLFNDTVDAKNTATKLNWFSKIPKMLRSFLMGILIAVIFYWVFGYNTRIDIFALFCSLISGMVLYKIGIDKIFKFISEKYLGFKFEPKIPVKPETLAEPTMPPNNSLPKYR